MAVRSCWILVGTGTRRHTSIQSITNTLIGWHVWWECRPWENWNIFSFQKLCKYSCDMGLCIITLFTSANRSPTQCHTCGLWLWDRLDEQPNSIKQRWRKLKLENWKCNSLATALVDIPAVSMPIALSLQTSVALCCVTKLHILEWPFIVHSTRCTWVNDCAA